MSVSVSTLWGDFTYEIMTAGEATANNSACYVPGDFKWLDWDHAGNFLGARYNTNAWFNFRNKWHANYGISRSDERVSNTALRGRPSCAEYRATSLPRRTNCPSA